MKKTIIKNEAYYTLAWSPLYKYDKYEALKIIPELAGIICLLYKTQNRLEYLIFYSCWRDGCRVGLRKFLDPDLSKFPDIVNSLDLDILYYKYTVIDESLKDMQDVMFWLLQTYKPLYNNIADFQDTQRYNNIYVKEIERNKDDIVEKIPGIKFT